MPPRKSKKQTAEIKPANTNAYIAGAGAVVEQQITDTLETNYIA